MVFRFVALTKLPKKVFIENTEKLGSIIFKLYS